MKLTKRPAVRRTDPTEQGEYMPGFQAQAMLVGALGVDALAAARILMEAAAGGQLPARCIRRKDEFYSHRHVPDDPAVITRQLRSPHEQSPAAVHPEDWTAILRQIDEIEAEGKEDDDAAFASLVRLASKHDLGRWSFHFWRTDAFENSQHTTLEDVDFRRSEVEELAGKMSRTARTTLPPISDSDLKKWWAKQPYKDPGNLTSIDEIVSITRAAHPDKSISRDRIRALIPSRKRGPKPLRGKMTAK